MATAKKKDAKVGNRVKGKQTGTYMKNGKAFRIVNGKKTNLRATTAEEHRAIGRMGGKASAEARAQKKTLKEDLEALLAIQIKQVKDPKLKKLLETLGIDTEEATLQTALNVALYKAMLKGNVKAYEIIQATVEQLPKKEAPAEQSQRRVEIVDDLPDD